MPVVEQTRVVPFRAEQMFDLVTDVKQYPEFLPWCVAARIREQSDAHMIADLVIGFQVIRERFTSDVRFDRAALRVDTALVDGPFRHLTNKWRFRDLPDGKGCEIEIHVDFAFRSALLQRLIEPLFEEAQKRMIGAFEKRARALYGAAGGTAGGTAGGAAGSSASSTSPKASATV